MAYNQVTSIITYDNSVRSYTIPSDCGEVLTVTMAGPGGPFDGDGSGGWTQADLRVTDTWRGVAKILCRTGGLGSAPSGTSGGAGGYNGGGSGGNATGSGGRPGYGGSGASDVRLDGTATPADTLANRRMVAAGAGATGRNNTTGSKGSGGDGGGSVGGSGTAATGSGAGNPGLGGTQSAGGAGGSGSTGGGTGSSGQGGNGGSNTNANAAAGGGGGGGYYGGGGSSSSTASSTAGGGGGSNYIDFNYFNSGLSGKGTGSLAQFNGQIIFQYYPTPQAPLILLPSSRDPEALVERPYTNLAVNPSMEGTFAWTVYNSSVTGVTKSSTKKRAGTYSGRIQWKQNQGVNAARVSLPLTGLAIGQWYGIGLWVLGDNVSGTPKVEPHVYGFVAYKKFDVTRQTVRNGTTWQRIQIKFQATASSHVFQLWNVDSIPNTASTTRLTYFDQLMIAPLENVEDDIPDYFDGTYPGASWNGTANASISTQAAYINPDLPFELNWRYIADATNNAPHWKSEVYYREYNTTTLNWDGPYYFDTVRVVAIKTVQNGAKLRATIPASPSKFLSGKRYRLYVRDMNLATNQFGQGSFLEFYVPTRPTAPVITSPALSYASPGVPNFPTVNTLPLKVAWSVVEKMERWRIRVFSYVNSVNSDVDLPLFDTGWQYKSIPAGSLTAGLINPPDRGLRLLIYLEVHDGTIASLPSLSAFQLPAEVTLLDGLIRKQGLELEVYDGVTGNFIDVIPERMEPNYLEELRGQGAGSFKLKFTDSAWLRSPNLINPRNVVRVKDRGYYIGFFIITGHEPTTIADGEESAEGVVVKGTGAYGIWTRDAILYPINGNSNFNNQLGLIGAKRSFGVASHQDEGNWFDNTNWRAATAMVRIDNTTAPSSLPTAGNPWRNNPSDWPSDMSTVYWIWSDDYRELSNPGVIALKQGFNNLESVPVAAQFYIAADDEAQVYLDGDPWVYSNDWHSTSQSEPVYVSPGYHEVTIIAAVANYPGGVSNYFKYPAGLVCGMYILGQGAAADAHTIYLRSSTTWLVTGYGILPSMTIGDILTMLYDEAVERGVTSFGNFNLGFDDLNDSYGLPWPKDGTQWIFDIFTQYDQIFDKLTDTACDIWFDENLTMQAARRRGVNRARLAAITNYFDLVRESSPTIFWDFQQVMIPVSIPAASLTTRGFPSSEGGGIAFPSVSGATPESLGFMYVQNDAANSKLQSPAREINGEVTTQAYMIAHTTRDINFYSKTWMDDPVNGDVLMKTTDPDGMTFEWLESDAYFQLQFIFFPPDATPTFDNAGSYETEVVTLSFYDASSNYFQQGQVILQSSSTTSPFFNTTWTRLDQRTHHWALNFFNTGPDGYFVLYRDGVELLTANWPFASSFGGFYVAGTQTIGSTTKKLNPGFGAVVFYDHLLTEDEIFDHYLAIQDVVYGGVTNNLGSQGIERIDPVIFRKSKNVKAAGATVTYDAKTALVARTSGGVTSVVAPSTYRSKFGRIEGYYDGSSKLPSEARRTASVAMNASLLAQTSNTIEIEGDYIPWRDFNVGDWILAPGDYGEELIKRRVVSIGITEDSNTGRSMYAIEVDSLDNDNGQRVALWLNRTLPQGSLGGLIADSG